MSEARDLTVGRGPAGLITIGERGAGAVSMSGRQALRVCDILDMWNGRARTVNGDGSNRQPVMVVPADDGGAGVCSGSDRITVTRPAMGGLVAALRNAAGCAADDPLASALAGGDRTDMELNQIGRAIRELRSELNSTNMILAAILASQSGGDNAVIESLMRRLGGDD